MKFLLLLLTVAGVFSANPVPGKRYYILTEGGKRMVAERKPRGSDLESTVFVANNKRSYGPYEQWTFFNITESTWELYNGGKWDNKVTLYRPERGNRQIIQYSIKEVNQGSTHQIIFQDDSNCPPTDNPNGETFCLENVEGSRVERRVCSKDNTRVWTFRPVDSATN